MLNISECLHGDGRGVSERQRVITKRTMLWSVFLMIVACALSNPKAVYSQWTASGNDISNTNTGNNGDCKTAWSQVGGGGSSQWTTSGSTIFYNTGNVGIGTSGAPTRRLEVLGGNVFHQYSTTAGSEYGVYTSLNNNHFTSNLYFDGQWKMIGSGKGSAISLGPNNSNQAFGVWADNTSRAANATATYSKGPFQ